MTLALLGTTPRGLTMKARRGGRGRGQLRALHRYILLDHLTLCVEFSLNVLAYAG